MDWTWVILGGAIVAGFWLWWRSRAIAPTTFVQPQFGSGVETGPNDTQALLQQNHPVDLSGVEAAHGEILALVQQNRKIEAIKLVRHYSGLGLKEAKEYVDALASNNPLPVLHAPTPEAPLPTDLAEAIRECLMRKQKIMAIRVVRERIGLGLKEAKEYVDAFENGRPLPPLPEYSQSAERPRLDAEIRALLAKNQKVQAVKLARERLGVGLGDAKDYVEQLQYRK